MAVAPPKIEITLDELLALGSDAHVEIINGEIVDMSPVGGLHQFIARNLFKILDTFVTERGLGIVLFADLIFLLGKKTKHLTDSYVPDISYIAKGSIPENWDIVKPFPGAPTLAVEIMSPGDIVGKLMRKVREYLKAGTEEVWLVFPEEQEIHQYTKRDPDTVRVYTGEAEVDTSVLFPGLILRAESIFVIPDFS
jgi:Uma2 family endonuclease